MLGSLYLLTNLINDKTYVGKTYREPSIRLEEHFRDAHRLANRPLYKAILKYGRENFEMLVLGQYPETKLEELEILLIKELDTYSKNGYNATLGGEGTKYEVPSKELIIETHKGNVRETAKLLETDPKRVKRVLNDQGIRTARGTAVIINELGLKFNSVTDCANYLIEENLTKNKYVRNKITDVLKGRRNSCLGFTYSYA
jgi:hypothetical protein